MFAFAAQLPATLTTYFLLGAHENIWLNVVHSTNVTWHTDAEKKNTYNLKPFVQIRYLVYFLSDFIYVVRSSMFDNVQLFVRTKHFIEKESKWNRNMAEATEWGGKSENNFHRKSTRAEPN